MVLVDEPAVGLTVLGKVVDACHGVTLQLPVVSRLDVPPVVLVVVRQAVVHIHLSLWGLEIESDRGGELAQW